MASCFTTVLKIINYILSGLLILLGLGMGVLSIVVLATSTGTSSAGFNVFNLILCIIIIIIGALGIWATTKQIRVAHGVFCCVGGIIFVIYLIAALMASAAVGSTTDYLASLDSSGLNRLSSSTPSGALYSVLREAYQELYQANSCQGPVCTFSSLKPSCSPITCASNTMSDNLNGYLTEGADNGGVTDMSLKTCLELTFSSSSYPRGAAVNTAWCVSNTAFIAFVDSWAVGILIGIWIITIFVLLVSVTNGILACTTCQVPYAGTAPAQPGMVAGVVDSKV
ncbi:hypothetical protein FOL46_008148 [Perkinsus olseni]|uniref:Uncharacterized protein n=1 Tax=Perkinsus olseni TaxID=32597 RepID=A0A7J6L911_PEROL|nr:hypothetical protein FOL46_008148 [Perkinsus olseni]